MDAKKEVKPNENYLIPAEVSAALMTRRPEMIGALVARLVEGEVLPKEQVIGLCKTIQDQILRWVVAEANLTELVKISDALEGFAKGVTNKVVEMDEALRKTSRGDLFDPKVFWEENEKA